MEEKKSKKFLEILKLISVGIFAGAVNGFFGAGGGLLLVPLISYSRKVEAKVAHATTLACVMFMCVASSVIYLVKGEVDYKLILLCMIGSIIGSLIGTKLLKNLKNNIIDLIFSCFMIAAGVVMIVFR